jgi:23S rRNA pseudouridine1911/1915/1917 synthase
MQKFEITVPALYISKRADAYLTEVSEGRFSRQEIKKLLESGGVLLNGSPAKPSSKISEGDVLTGVWPEVKPSGLSGEDIPIKVIYEDDDIIVIDKAVGMVVHPGAANKTGTLVQALLGRGGELSTVGGIERPGIVHRLDKDTSGVLIVAKNNESHRLLQTQFQERSLTKIYIALVRGHVEFEEGHIDKPMGRDPKVREKMAVSRSESAREAMTHYKVLKRFRYTTLVEVRIETGRTHQIRVHFSHLGHPVVGDSVYGSAAPGERLALHAAKIEFMHPKNGKILRFESPLPDDLKELIKNAERIR